MDLEQQVVEPTNSEADAEESAMVITVEEGEGEVRETSTGGVRSSPKRKTSGVGVAIAERHRVITELAQEGMHVEQLMPTNVRDTDTWMEVRMIKVAKHKEWCGNKYAVCLICADTALKSYIERGEQDVDFVCPKFVCDNVGKIKQHNKGAHKPAELLKTKSAALAHALGAGVEKRSGCVTACIPNICSAILIATVDTVHMLSLVFIHIISDTRSTIVL